MGRHGIKSARCVTLARAGHIILTASDGEEGLRVALEKKPDVIVLDMMLPKLGGAQLLRLLKTDPLTASIPVIVLSSLAQKNAERLIADGAAAYLEKSQLEVEKSSNQLWKTVSQVLLTSATR